MRNRFNILSAQGENGKFYPLDISAPSDPLQSGVYSWSITYNILPIPIVSNIVSDILLALQNDQQSLSNILAQNGYAGTATIIGKSVSTTPGPLPFSVSSVTITYNIAFTSPPLVALIGFIPAILTLITTAIIGIVIVSVVSALERMTSKPSYTPIKPGECAAGYVYDSASNLCKPIEPSTITNIIPFVIVGVVAIVLVPVILDYLKKNKK